MENKFVIVTESDTDNILESRGPIVGEQYLQSASYEEILERAKSIGNRYGRKIICRLQPIGNPETLPKHEEELQPSINQT